jgi:hypothetical protein
MAVEVLPLNVVNMLHNISRLETSKHDQMKERFSKMSLEQWCMSEVPSWDSTSTFLNSAYCIDDSFFNGDLREEEEITNDNLCRFYQQKNL